MFFRVSLERPGGCHVYGAALLKVKGRVVFSLGTGSIRYESQLSKFINVSCTHTRTHAQWAAQYIINLGD